MSTAEDHVENGSPNGATESLDTDVKAPQSAVENRWPGWPGWCVFRLVVPTVKVGSIIGKKGDLIKKLCEETRARVRVLDGPVGNPDRIVLITGKEEPESPLSPAMDAAIRVFKRVNDEAITGAAFCSIRLLVASTQAVSLIGKQGTFIKSMQASTGATIRILDNDELPQYASKEERIAELQGEAAKVLKALEAVLTHLRKFLVDQTVLPLFEKTINVPVTQEHQIGSWAEKSLLHSTSRPGITADYPPPGRTESLFLERETQLEQRISSSGVPLYSQDYGLSGLRSSALGRAGGPIVTQVAQTMQIPLSYAEDIIGIGGANIAHIRRASGAILTVQESRVPDEITVEIKGTSVQVQTAQQLIQDSVSSNKEPVSRGYGHTDDELRPSSYSQLGGSYYTSSSLPTQPYGGAHGSSNLGGYGSYRY